MFKMICLTSITLAFWLCVIFACSFALTTILIFMVFWVVVFIIGAAINDVLTFFGAV